MKKIIEKLRKYVDGDADTWFEYFMLFIIFINIISIGLETLPIGQKYEYVFLSIDKYCLYIFIFELLLKIIAFNKNFFKYGWNIFDLVIVLISVGSILPCFGVFRVFKIFRSLRTVRSIKSIRAIKALKFVNGLEQLQQILKAIILSFSGIAWTLLLLFIIYYVYAIIGTNILGTDFPEFFGSLGKSLLSLFQIMTFDSWCSQIARPVITKYNWTCIYFISFAVLSSFIIMNIIVGIVVDSIEQSRKIYAEKKYGIKEVSNSELLGQIQNLQNQILELKNKL